MLPDGLLDLVKNRLDITWSDDTNDKKISNIILNGIAELDYLSGVQNNYTIAGKAQSLLFSYVIYALSNSLDDFKINYKSDIVSFINQSKVRTYVEKQSQSI